MNTTLIMHASEGRIQFVLEQVGSLACAQEWSAPSKGTELLTPALADAFQRLGIMPSDISRIACVAGPGSFTGLRLALTTAAAFCRAIEQAGYTAGIYFNLQMGYHTYNLSPLKDYTLWIAEPGKYPSFYYHAALWQYDHSGTVPGIDTPAARNLLFEGL